MNTDLNKILAERGNTHGDFNKSSSLVQSMKSNARHSATLENVYLSAAQWEALDNIFGKIGRIVCGDPSHIDSWVDIQGYAKLAEDNTKQLIAERLENERKERDWVLGRGQRGIASPFLEPTDPNPNHVGSGDIAESLLAALLTVLKEQPLKE